MATTKVSALAAKTSIAGSEELLINDGGTSKKVTATNLLAGVTVADGAISTAKLAADAVTGAKIADDAIDSEHYTDGSIDTAHIADDAVTAAKLANSINTDIATGVTANTTANAALPKTGGAMTGAITTNSTFDGRDVATDGTKLDGIEANADVTDTANVTAAGALMDSELASESAVKALTGTNTGDQTITLTGNVTGSGTGSFAATIANDAVTVDKLNLISTGSVPSLEAKGTSGVTDGYIQLNCSENSHGIKLKSPPHSAAASYTLTFPNNDGNADEVLTTNGSGVLSWSAAGGNTTTNGLYEHAHTISSNYSITSGNNAITAGPITINTGVSVTVPTGSTWVVA